MDIGVCLTLHSLYPRGKLPVPIEEEDEIELFIDSLNDLLNKWWLNDNLVGPMKRPVERLADLLPA
jgi:hypothetical protein